MQPLVQFGLDLAMEDRASPLTRRPAQKNSWLTFHPDFTNEDVQIGYQSLLFSLAFSVTPYTKVDGVRYERVLHCKRDYVRRRCEASVAAAATAAVSETVA